MPATLIIMSADPGLLQHWGALASRHPVTILNQWLPLPPPSIDVMVIIDTLLPGLPPCTDNHIAELTARYKTILVSSTPSDAEGVSWLSNGAAGYCHAFAAHGTLQQVLDVVGGGGLWVGRSLLATLLRSMQTLPAATTATVAPLTTLTEREQEVARLAAKGQSNKEIARQLDITERTVKAHLTSVFQKLGVSDRLQLTLLINGIQ
ncbi:DNA-binding NarL/FixJ family response regulator [Chitinivorax tropicus]|uniref:DNA-binding NarL/FixJ family response regulator n=1 Tax=Chitinivorax tropicus TaxID=714531 RepID=A0A840MM74_9PROT|nr:response regulator transcription factor [Chitinivorax tropicus]MBB5018229.1 DNA-binding NarL/FixJ family response regulator [Chitinivorax tropicus]